MILKTLLKPPKYRQSLFRSEGGSVQSTRGYMTDAKLKSDPRMRRISRLEKELVCQYIEALPSGAVVADVPCGNGRMSQLVIQREDLRLVAIDYNPLMLDAIKSLGNERLSASCMQGDALDLPLEDRSVDLVINMRLLHHVAEQSVRVRMLSEMARVCRGLVITSFWSTHSWRYLRRRILNKSIRGYPISPRTFAAVCTEAGLSIERMVPVRRWYEEQWMAVCRRG